MFTTHLTIALVLLSMFELGFADVPALWPRLMTVSVSTFLTGRYGRNCLYLN